MIRNVKKVVMGSTQFDGAGVKLVRVLSRPDVEEFDPFLMLDAFDSLEPEDYIKGFPWHPHRGIETITYLIMGDIEHGDSLGNKGSILDGCCQWMTAGSGIIHQEMPKETTRMLGVQLWLNLPKADKMTSPKYRDIKAYNIPLVKSDKIIVNVISGEYNGVIGATQGDNVKIKFLDVDMDPGAEFKLSTDSQDNLFIYIIAGEGYFGENDKDIQLSKRAVLFTEGDEFVARTYGNGMRFLLLSGKPLKESVAWGGPIVMNTEDELNLAFKELKEGTFIK